jgi:ElaB/YqjD/DUF883 family membrane-anchored ribosome-binding protein
MGPEADEIRKHIEAKRDELGAHLNELEYRVKHITDWRAQALEHPGKALGVAFGAGVLLALVLS